jgi:membrane fusion protein (multidrug efflux system)
MSASATPAKIPKSSRIPGIVWRVLAFLAAAVVIFVFVTRWNRWQEEARYQTTDDAYLQSNLTPLSAQISGYVAQVPVQDYDHVKAGQLIALIDDRPYWADVAQAKANIASAQAGIEQVWYQRPLLEANLQAAQAVVVATAAQLAQSERDVARQTRLYISGSSSKEQLEQVRTTHAQLLAELHQNQAQAAAVQRQIDLLTAQQDQTRAAWQAAQAALRLAEINLGYTRIVAPNDGVISTRQVLPGQFIAAGTQVTTLAALPTVWVTANYKETQLTHVVIGERAMLTVDSFPGRMLHGHVIAISPASGAEFALLPPDNATGNFTKIVQRVAVKISVDDPGNLAGRLLPGMSSIPTIDTVLPDGSRP